MKIWQNVCDVIQPLLDMSNHLDAIRMPHGNLDLKELASKFTQRLSRDEHLREVLEASLSSFMPTNTGRQLFQGTIGRST